ncbi:zinc finger MYM-type protein 4 [Limanda limanda]|uniref:zinc finger MYM-type protein 4 n=1 Tax=Limanda limanda TaxID=27771 RepID=UPI0029C9360A|nr:zinc finger MYM-type protein 4 [Limanda limanda]
MAATGSGEGHQRLATDPVPSVQVSSAVKEETDVESMEAVPDPELVHGSSPRLSEPGEVHYILSSDKEWEKESGAAGIPYPVSVSSLNPSASQSSFSTNQTIRTAVDRCGESGSSSESGPEGTEVKTEEEFETNEQNVVVNDNSLKEEAVDVKEDTDMETASDFKEEITNDGDEDPGVAFKQEIDAQQEDETHDCKPMASTTHDLDEMMDIGTVDQVEQEAQMKEEEQENSPADVGNRGAPGTSSEVAMKEEADVKPTILTPPPADDQAEDVKLSLDRIQSSSSPSSTTTTSTGRESSSPKAVMNGMKVFNPSLPRIDAETSQADPSSPSPVKVKDEPEDEEYDQALMSSAFTASVKDEQDTVKEDLKIGVVFSVSPAAETQTLPTAQPSTSLMSCFKCKKSLIKGQTAFQRKGSTSLFCSTDCLTTSLPNAQGGTKICYNCQKVIIRPQDVILAPDTKGVMREFCGQNCLTSFNYKKNCSSFMKQEFTKSTPNLGPPSICSMCTRYCISKHEVILSGSVHKICSDTCFNRFRSVNNLSMSSCGHCGSFCHSKPLMLRLEDGNKTLCNSECLAKYKERSKVTQPCMMCQTSCLLAETIDNKNTDDSVSLFCSSSCLMAFKVKTVSSSGARFICDSCGKNSVPAYHLAMSDTSIRNFCRLQCVMVFQENFKKTDKCMNVFTKLPIESTQVQPVTPPEPQQFFSNVRPNLDCSQCARNIMFKPEVIQIKDKLFFLCGVDCSKVFKRVNYVTSLCEYCKIEKITSDAKTIDNKDCYFCSDGCKRLFRHDLSKNWGKHCNSCVYCHCVSKKLVTAQYGGSTEDFCSEECRFKYTMLFCHVAKCDTCGCKGKLKESLPLLGEVKHFCDLTCLLKFCSHKVATQVEVLKGCAGPGEATPIIANVISLAEPPTEKHDDSDRTAAQQSTVSQTQSKKSGHIGVQTEAVKLPAPPAAPAPKILKNKALLCRPLVENKGVSCKAQTADVESQTDVAYPEVLILPVPVPVFVPVPMNMYSQFTPRPMCLPLPLPVPMFLPVTMNSAERIIETIQAIKEKIPSDPFEAELILMAEMVAEQDENSKPERPKAKVLEKRTERQDAPDDHTSNFSDDLDTEELTSFLNNWEDASSDAGLRSPGRGYTQEKFNSAVKVPGGRPSEPYPEPPPPAPPPMDIEADFTVETLERMSRLREKGPPPATTQRRRPGQRKARDKRGRKAQRSKAAAAANQKGSPNKDLPSELPKLNSEYGLDAWKRWIQWRQTQPNVERPRIGSRPIELKEDLLRCTTAELSYGLCCFITEAKRPNGEQYSPDSIFYLCLGIQQYLFDNSRVENIFMDRFYNKFSTEFTTMLRAFKPPVTATGYIHSRVEEDYLWDCKQLGAYSPIVLLNTLLFFCCKYFGFTAVEQHRQLSFAHVMRCTKTNLDNTKTIFLRFYPPISINEAEPDAEVPSKKRKEDEAKEEILEMVENTENPLRCPVRLYEFYLSKCSESVKQRTNLFYLLPERCCVPNSPLWFSSSALDDTTMEAMLTRILTVRELHLQKSKEGEAGKSTPKDPPFIPEEEEDGDSE